jgi:hypothetical protein
MPLTDSASGGAGEMDLNRLSLLPPSILILTGGSGQGKQKKQFQLSVSAWGRLRSRIALCGRRFRQLPRLDGPCPAIGRGILRHAKPALQTLPIILKTEENVNPNIMKIKCANRIADSRSSPAMLRASGQAGRELATCRANQSALAAR